ncbi:MAG: hypothetical protein UT55_C0009G0007 [Candidatus Peregrinibacteria bacterium GW2011_GWE2_39_6]|nr:MAG: hypothetical protein UT55_C0009G0007 [Candidatus Peregrinibacteria bacterium GW2011_GWE2_39_6]
MNLLLLAIAPSFALGIFFYIKDKYEKEPLKLLLKTFILGTLTIVPAAILEGILFSLFGLDLYQINNLPTLFLSMIFFVALIEEVVKFSVVRFYIWNKKDFNEPYDGIIYTVMASLGFATFENILYVFSSGATVGLLRAFLTVPVHALTAAIMGYYIGLAKYPRVPGKNQYLIKGLMVAILFHGTFTGF